MIIIKKDHNKLVHRFRASALISSKCMDGCFAGMESAGINKGAFIKQCYTSVLASSSSVSESLREAGNKQACFEFSLHQIVIHMNAKKQWDPRRLSMWLSNKMSGNLRMRLVHFPAFTTASRRNRTGIRDSNVRQCI